MARIEELIENASHDMFNPELNFQIAQEYESMGQTAAAVSFYLRAAEYGHDSHPLVVYASLLRMSFCFEDQTGREHTVTNCLLQAIQYMPTRPEGYFLLSRFYERSQKWQECYTFAEIGLQNAGRLEKLPAYVEYDGSVCLLFEKAVSGWWVGRQQESKSIFKDLLEQDIPDGYRSTIEYNLKLIGSK
jgi:tetratricopeptide (TPR) repeat protein